MLNTNTGTLDGSPRPPRSFLTPVDRIRRIRVFIDTLGDSLEYIGKDFGEHIADRAWITSYVNNELADIASDLEREDAP